MVEKITWLPGAQATFKNALDYLLENFSDQEAKKFSDRINQKLELMRSHPQLGKRSNKNKSIYKTVILKKIVLVYQYKPLKKEILLLAFWNTLQDPRKLRL